MTTFFWIYGCSWLVLLIVLISVYISQRNVLKRNSFGFYLIMFLVAPIIVVCMPYLFISTRKKEKEEKRRKEAIKLQEQLEEEAQQRALNKFMEVISKSTNADTECIELAYFVHQKVDEEQYDVALNCLNKLYLADEKSLKVKCCEQNGHGERSKIYVELGNGYSDYNIFDHLSVENSELGAWQVYLLSSLWHKLPLWWHALYDLRVFVFENKDIPKITTFGNEPTGLSAGLQFDVSPKIFKEQNTYYVSCCYWNDWSGLVRECVEIEFAGNKVVNVSILYSEVLFEYKSGLRF